MPNQAGTFPTTIKWYMIMKKENIAGIDLDML